MQKGFTLNSSFMLLINKKIITYFLSFLSWNNKKNNQMQTSSLGFVVKSKAFFFRLSENNIKKNLSKQAFRC